MANKKISQLPAISVPLTGSDLFEVAIDLGGASYESRSTTGNDIKTLVSTNVSNTLFVDGVYGDNLTAQNFSLTKPYRTITAAAAAAVALGSTTPIVIYIRAGQYTGGLIFRNNIYYYAEKGVVFTSGNATDSVSDQQANSGLFGYAQFLGSSGIILNYGCNITMEFDKVENALNNDGFFVIRNSNLTYNPTVNITCNSLKTTAPNANGCRIRGKVNVNLIVKEFIRSPYSVIDIREHGGNNYQGTLNITCPKIVIEEGGQFGNNAAYKQCLVTYGVAATSIININGDLYNEVANATFLGSNSACMTDWTTSNGYTLRFNGNIYAGTQRALLNNSGSKQFIEGNISTTSIVASVSAGNTHIKNSTIVRGDSADTNAVINVGSANLFLNDCTIYNGDSLGALNTIRLTTSASRVYANNIVCQQAATSDFFMGGITGSSAGMINVQSNRSNNSITSLYTATGYTQEANLRVPQYI
jgi:hypothetical protein